MIPCLLTGALGLCLLAAWLFAPIALVLPPLKTGDYSRAESWARLCRWCLGGDLVHAAVLVQSGKLVEATAVLDAVIERGGPGWHPLALVRLLDDDLQGARFAVQRALEAEPEMEVYRATLVEILLLQGTASPALWRHVDAARSQAEDPLLQWSAPGLLAGIESLTAWLHARMDEPVLAEEAIAKALATAEPYVFVQADVHWRIGMTYLTMERPCEARRHFEVASAADPDGIHGARATKVLSTLPPTVQNAH